MYKQHFPSLYIQQLASFLQLYKINSVFAAFITLIWSTDDAVFVVKLELNQIYYFAQKDDTYYTS